MNSVLKILTELKKQKIAASAIEKELKFSNGLLGKAAKGTTALSAEKMEKFVKYYDLKKESLTQPANASAFDGSHVNLIKQDEPLQFQPLRKGMKMLNIPKDQVTFPWIKLITDYCQEKGIVPEDLITIHKEVCKGTITKKDVDGWKSFPKEVNKQIDKHQTVLSDFIKARQKSKNGQS